MKILVILLCIISLWCNKQDKTKLHLACIKGDITEVGKLIFTPNTNNAIIDAQDNNGNTPLHYACCFNHSEIITILMAAGANENIANNYQETSAVTSLLFGYQKQIIILTPFKGFLFPFSVENKDFYYYYYYYYYNVVVEDTRRT
jgi:ankyrin repeat protein